VTELNSCPTHPGGYKLQLRHHGRVDQVPVDYQADLHGVCGEGQKVREGAHCKGIGGSALSLWAWWLQTSSSSMLQKHPSLLLLLSFLYMDMSPSAEMAFAPKNPLVTKRLPPRCALASALTAISPLKLHYQTLWNCPPHGPGDSLTHAFLWSRPPAWEHFLYSFFKVQSLGTPSSFLHPSVLLNPWQVGTPLCSSGLVPGEQLHLAPCCPSQCPLVQCFLFVCFLLLFVGGTGV
jgi:hypothetical protein